MFPLVHTIAEACAGAKTGRTTLYKAIQDGRLRAVKLGKHTRILDEDLREFVRSLPQLEPAKRVEVAERNGGQSDGERSA
jgi:excisionase family DNA binding protein